jgi:hypothetical protein
MASLNSGGCRELESSDRGPTCGIFLSEAVGCAIVAGSLAPL